MNKKISEIIKIVLVAIVFATIVRSFIGEIYIVIGDSMLPSLHHSDRIVLSKLPHTIDDYQRGDIVVIDYQTELQQNIIKRIIALPGESITIHDQTIYIDGKPLTETYLDSATEGSYVEVAVPEGKFFVMGDNRNYSLDSRFSEIGFVEFSRVKGKAKLIIWPISNWQVIQR